MMPTSLQKVSLILLIQALESTAYGNLIPIAEGDNSIGPGGENYVDSDHFRFFDTPGDKVQHAIDLVEGCLQCFFESLGWRNPMLSNDDADDSDGPFTKINIYTVDRDISGNAGQMITEGDSGDTYIEVRPEWVDNDQIIVHEFAHVLHNHQKTWVSEPNAYAWWETVANWIADTYHTSQYCGPARDAWNIAPAESTIFNPVKVIGDSFQVLVDATKETGNYYEAWPFLTYLTTNLDNYGLLGTDAVLRLQKEYQSGETPLHTLGSISPTGTWTVQQVVGKYWARMAYVDIGHDLARNLFLDTRKDDGAINFRNVDSIGVDMYRVKPDRQPRYMGANIIPLDTFAGSVVDVKIDSTGEYTAYLAVRNWEDWTVQYFELIDGAVTLTMQEDEEVSLVVAHTPTELISYNGFDLAGSPASNGLDYSFKMTGATVLWM